MAILAGLLLIGALAALAALGVLAVRYQAERSESARIRALFSRYVAPPIVDELLRRKDPRLYTGRAMQATIAVCRIQNFAGFAEDLSAEETLRYLNEFFALAGTSFQKHGGMIDKFLSDGMIGVFGVPLEDAAAEEHALRAAIDIVRLVDTMDARWRAAGRPSFRVSIGINSGTVIAGDAGFHERRVFTVVGPETLVAARLQEATTDLSASIVASAATCKPVRHLFSVLPLVGHPLPGLKRLTDAYVVLGLLRGDAPLAMPAAHVFRETAIEAPAAQRAMPPPPEIAPLPRVELIDPAAPLTARRRLAESAADSAFALPDFRAPSRFDDANEGPIFPDPPARPTTYDNGNGPPAGL
jgi:class 3 adenylate cyclase